MQRYLARVAGEAKCDRSTQDVKEVCRHVVPVPARRLGHRLKGANVLGADATVGCGREPEVAVFGVFTQSFAIPGRLGRAHMRERGQRLREFARAVVARNALVMLMHGYLSFD